ncbi:IclR family transcriptional regulator [Amycolatopsis jejuensis]|uniref:IclR family transcriptional regulator n=1 Tax=Amycolatopsis jejuensis TaxID=330084 RepID=UPI00068B9920|nr:IclR family transcriptional regulator [Amycolatopsis jejuensis]
MTDGKVGAALSWSPLEEEDSGAALTSASSGVAPVRSVARAVDIMSVLGGGARPLGDISVEVKLSKATTYRILLTLKNKGMVLQDETTGEYRLGPGCFRLMAALVDGRAGFPFDAEAELEHLRSGTQETVMVHVRAGFTRLCIHELPSPHAIRYTAGIGATAGIHVGSAGKVLLAFMPPAELEALLSSLELRPETPNTIVDMAELRAALAETQQTGVAYSVGERVSGAVGVSAPVLDDRGFVVAALSVLGPESRLDKARLTEFEGLVRHTAEQISQRIRTS